MKNEIKFKGVIDRLEGNMAVVLLGEEEEAVELPLSYLPEGAKESDILTIKVQCKKDKTKLAKEKVQGMIDKLRQK